MDAGAQYLERGNEIFSTPVFGARGGALATAAGTRLSVVERPGPRPVEPPGLRDRIASETFEEMEVEFDSQHQAVWCRFAFKGRPSFTPTLLNDIQKVQQLVRQSHSSDSPESDPVRYIIWASRMPGVWNLGGDLNLFSSLIRAKDRDTLQKYAFKVVEEGFKNHTALDLPITTVSLIQGDALGGGFEAALSSNLILAEKSAKFGLPEILFNLFPGMGAYTFLARRIAPALAERMITSGRIYSAQDLYEMGVVDVLADDGEGESKLCDYMKSHTRSHATYRAIYKVRQRVHPIRLEEMIDIARIWVDTAMGLEEPDLRRMERLVAAQDRRRARIDAGA